MYWNIFWYILGHSDTIIYQQIFTNHWRTIGIDKPYGDGSIPINTIFSGMNIHLPAILMFTTGTRFWHTAIWTLVEHSWALLRTPGGFRWLECASALPLSCLFLDGFCPKMLESTKMALVVGTWWWNTEPKWCSWNSVKLYHLPFRKKHGPKPPKPNSFSLSLNWYLHCMSIKVLDRFAPLPKESRSHKFGQRQSHLGS